jgi:hypothetical protein
LFAKPISVSTYPATITVTHASDADCSSGETYTYNVSAPPNGETLALAVPVGASWTFQRTSPTVGTAMPGVVVPPTSSTVLAL